MGYCAMDVVDVEFRRLKESLAKQRQEIHAKSSTENHVTHAPTPAHLDFTTIRVIHTNYLARVLDGCLLTNPIVSVILRQILDVCERFVALVERWGGDVLPALLFEGSLRGDNDEKVGALVMERWSIVAEIDEVSQLWLNTWVIF